MVRLVTTSTRMLLFASGTMAAASLALCQEAGPYFKGKSITVITSTGEGGLYDVGARLISVTMPKHLAGQPTMVVKNMPGGGHTRATNYLFGQSPTDGTTIGTISNTMPLHQVIDGKGARYDASKFNWIGSTGISNLTIAVWHETGVRSINAVKSREVITGATGVGSGTFLYPNLLNNLIGTKFKIVLGYRRATDINLAIERGEVHARAGSSYASLQGDKPDWLRENKLIFLTQIGAYEQPELNGVPLFHDLGGDDEQRRILELISSPVKFGRPYVAPPGVNQDVIAQLRKAFLATVADKNFVAQAKKRGLDLYPVTGEDLTKFARDTINVPPKLLARAKEAIQPPASLITPEAERGK